MRLADLLRCGCGATWPEEMPQPTGKAAAASAAPHRPPAALRDSRRSRSRSRRRRDRREGSGDGPSATWRPSLSAISENSAPAAAARERKMSAAGGAVKAKPGSVSRRVLPRSHSDDHRYIDSYSAAQAYSPTAFLF